VVTIDRRRNIRFYVHEPVEVLVLKSDVVIVGRILDISQSGVGITVPEAVSIMDVVEVRSKRLRLLAEVRHCREIDGEHVLGLEFCNEILKSEIQSVRTQQTLAPEPPQSYLDKLPGGKQ
jgi:hypothetical protein